MSDKSPLFVSALELLAHSTELYSSAHKRKYKFVILHLANSIELILKDILIDKGISIYKNRSTETISIWSAFEELNSLGVVFPERPIIELLIDDRNTIQHRFGFPDAESVYYYLDNVVQFFSRILEEQYSVKLVEALGQHLSKENLQLIGLIENELEVLDRLYRISPESAVIEAYQHIEKEYVQIMQKYITDNDMKKPLMRNKLFLFFLTKLEDAAYTSDAIGKFQLLRNTRNKAAHASINEEERPTFFIEAIEIAKELLSAISKAKKDNYFTEERLETLINKSGVLEQK
ncbi:hypothetical protein GCM10008915_10720 [Bifidobacterium pullorum subsp. gallinarum]